MSRGYQMRLHNRMIRPGFWTDPDLIRHLPLEGRFYYIGLVQLADDSGCLYADTLLHKIHLFPGDSNITPETIDGWLGKLEALGKVVRYEADGVQCLFLTNFHKHQRLRNPAPPGVPLPPWIIYKPGEKARQAGRYVVLPPYGDEGGEEAEQTSVWDGEDGDDTAPYGDVTESIPSPYGDHIVTNLEPRTLEPKNQEDIAAIAAIATAHTEPDTQPDSPLLGAVDPPPKRPTIPYQGIVDAWNEVCGDVLQRVKFLTDKRRDQIRARVTELARLLGDDVYSVDWWREVFRRVRASPFCCGAGREGWRATFDWIITRRDAVPKVLEGVYDAKERRGDSGALRGRAGSDQEADFRAIYLGAPRR